MHSPQITTLALFLVIAITLGFVAAAPTVEEVVDDKAENFEQTPAENEQQDDVAQQEVQPEVGLQQADVAQPQCIRICAKWSIFRVCISWKSVCSKPKPIVCIRLCVQWSVRGGRRVCIRVVVRCRRNLNEDQVESANVQGSEVEQQADVGEQEVGLQSEVPEGLAVRPGCRRICLRRDRFGRCIKWIWRCPRNEDLAANVLSSESETEDKVYRSLSDEQENIAEQEEVQQEVQDAEIAPTRGCGRVCVRRGRFGVCVSWRWRCSRNLNDDDLDSPNVQDD